MREAERETLKGIERLRERERERERERPRHALIVKQLFRLMFTDLLIVKKCCLPCCRWGDDFSLGVSQPFSIFLNLCQSLSPLRCLTVSINQFSYSLS